MHDGDHPAAELGFALAVLGLLGIGALAAVEQFLDLVKDIAW